MKNVIKLSVFLCSILFLSANLSAQGSLSACSNLNIVAQDCVGACQNPATLTYQVSGPCPSLVVPLCVSNISSSLCPSHRAIARVFVNNQPVASGNITVVGSNISFNAPCGSTVKVVVKAIDVVNIDCIWLGNLDFAISR